MQSPRCFSIALLALVSLFSTTPPASAQGTVRAWGYNTHGQLGDGTRTNRSAPVQVKSLIGVTAIAEGEAHSLALKRDGTVWAWGSNDYGQLGDGSPRCR